MKLVIKNLVVFIGILTVFLGASTPTMAGRDFIIRRLAEKVKYDKHSKAFLKKVSWGQFSQDEILPVIKEIKIVKKGGESPIIRAIKKHNGRNNTFFSGDNFSSLNAGNITLQQYREASHTYLNDLLEKDIYDALVVHYGVTSRRGVDLEERLEIYGDEGHGLSFVRSGSKWSFVGLLDPNPLEKQPIDLEVGNKKFYIVNPKIVGQMALRKWTTDDMLETLKEKSCEVIEGKQGLGLKFYNSKIEKAILVDPKNMEIFMVGDKGFKYPVLESEDCEDLLADFF